MVRWRGPGFGRLSVDEMQRSRILGAVVEIVSEHGVAGASVEPVIVRAHISRRTFYKHFDDLRECLIAVLDDAYRRAAVLVGRAFEDGESWVEGMRSALAKMLAFFDSEPALARVCLVEMAAGDALVREHRGHILGAFRALIVERLQGEVKHASPLASEGTLASIVGIICARLIEPDARPLVELLGPLMGLIVGPFMDEAQVAWEIERSDALAREMLVARQMPPGTESAAPSTWGNAEVPATLAHPSAFRLRQCLLYVALHPGASNREIASGVGVSHRGQTAMLLSRLAGMGLLVKRAGAPGHPHAWRPTAEGETVARTLERELDGA